MPLKSVPAEALLDLRRRLADLAPHSSERRRLVQEAASLYGVSESTLYRRLRAGGQLHAAQRRDRGVPKVLPEPELIGYCELIAAIKIRTSNKKDRHLPTTEAIRLLEEYGLDTPAGFVQAPRGVLTKPTVNRYLKRWGLDRQRLTREPPVVRFQAEHSNALWQFDISPSDLKQIERPSWIDENRGRPPTLMLFSVVDDRSGAAYQEYHCTYGEEAETSLRFLFNAMAPKADETLALCGRPLVLYMDPGPVRHSAIFQRVMRLLDIEVTNHVPRGKDGRRTTARSKGKIDPAIGTVASKGTPPLRMQRTALQGCISPGLLFNVLRAGEPRGKSKLHRPLARTAATVAGLPPSRCKSPYYLRFYPVLPIGCWNEWDQSSLNGFSLSHLLHRFHGEILRHQNAGGQRYKESNNTTLLWQLQDRLRKAGTTLVAESLAVDVNRVNLNTLKQALYYDLATEKDGDLPSKPEKSERILISLIQRCERPVVLFVDDAHDLNANTLRGLKRIIERVHRRRGRLSILLAGHPKLRNDLRRPAEAGER